MKELATSLSRTQPISSVSSVLDVPPKNIKRWMEKGLDRAKGGGRKPFEPQMEARLHELILKHQIVTRRQAVEFARQNSSSGFQASKGWWIKFTRRYNLNGFKFQPIDEQLPEVKSEEIFLDDSPI